MTIKKNICILHLHSYSNFILKIIVKDRVIPILQIRKLKVKKVSEPKSSDVKSCPFSITAVSLLNLKLLGKVAAVFEHYSELH